MNYDPISMEGEMDNWMVKGSVSNSPSRTYINNTNFSYKTEVTENQKSVGSLPSSKKVHKNITKRFQIISSALFCMVKELVLV